MGRHRFALIGVAVLVIVVVIGYFWLSGNASPDTQRMSDMHKLHDVLATYFKDNGKYPMPPASVDCTAPYNNVGGLSVALTPKYLDKIPHDPNPASCVYNYLYISDQNNYMILARLDDIDPGKYSDRWCIGAMSGSAAMTGYSYLPCP